jgi:hypothetical protein
MSDRVVIERRIGPAGLRARFLDWSPEISLLIATTAAGVWAGGRWLDPTGDPGIWWSAIDRLARGERLYRDLYLQFGPLSPYLLAFGARLFGASTSFFLLSAWFAAMGACVLLLRAAKPALGLAERFAVAGLLFSECLFAPGPGRLVFAYAPAAVHALLFSAGALMVRNGSRRAIAPYLAGLLAGLAFCSKQEIGMACLIALLVAQALESEPVRQAARSLLAFSFVVLCGAAVVLSSAPIGTLRGRSHFWPLALSPPERWNHLYARVAGLSQPDWPATLGQSAWGLLWYLGLVALLGLLISREGKPSRWLTTAALLALVGLRWAVGGSMPSVIFLPAVLSAAVAVLSAILALSASKLPGRTTILSLSVFAALVGARTVFSAERSGPYSGVAHFAAAATWVFFLCVLAPGIVPGAPGAANWCRRVWTVLLLAFAATGVVASVRSLAEPAKEGVRTPQGRVFVDRDAARLFQALGENLREGERIWVLPEIDGVDALFRVKEVSPYPSHLPGWLDDEAQIELIHRIEKHPPDAVVIFSRSAREYGVADFGKGYDRRLSEWIDRNYSVVVDLPAGRILRPSVRSPS